MDRQGPGPERGVGRFLRPSSSNALPVQTSALTACLCPQPVAGVSEDNKKYGLAGVRPSVQTAAGSCTASLVTSHLGIILLGLGLGLGLGLIRVARTRRPTLTMGG